MSGSVIGALRVVLGADTASFDKGLDGAQRTLNRFNKDMQKLSAKFAGIGQTLTLGLTVPIAAFSATLMQGAKDAAHASGQVEAALKSMGDGGGKSLEGLKRQAEELSKTSLFDDDLILTKVTANLLTFGNVAGDAFDRAQQAALNLSARMGTDLQASTIMLGKALNEPVKGLAALRRVGIQFTEQQQSLVKSMVAAGDVVGAQSIILGELERQYGGAAEAARKADPMAGAMLDLGRAMGTLEAQMAPVVVGLAGIVTSLANVLESLSPAQAQFTMIGLAVAAAIGPVLVGFGMLISAVGTIAGLFAGPAVAGMVAFLLPFAPIIAAVGALIAAFFLFRDKFTPVIEAAKEVVGAFGALVVDLFAPGSVLGTALEMFLGLAKRVFDGVVSIVGTQIEVLTNILKALAALFRGDFSAMWGYLGNAALTMVKGVVKAFSAMFPEVVSWVKKTWEGVKLWLVDKFATVVKAVQEKIAAVTGFFKAMWDAVVGHSYVPDMVDGIRDHFARLDKEMVKPALQATAEVTAAFAKMNAHLSPGGPVFGSKQNARGPNALANDNGHGGSSPDLMIFGGKAMTSARVEELRKQFVSFGRSFTDAVRAGRLQDFFADIANQFVDKLVNQGLNALFNSAGSSSSGAGFFNAIASIFGGGQSVPGFATGGSFTVGGSGAMDSKLVQFRATPGEMVNITKGERGQRQATTNVFDMRGAVVTQDLLNQMNQIAANGDAQVLGAVAREKTRQDKASRYTVARARR